MENAMTEDQKPLQVLKISLEDRYRIQIYRLHLLAMRNPPDKETLDYLVEEAKGFWKKIPLSDLPNIVNRAIIDLAPNIVTIPYVQKFWEKENKPYVPSF